MKLGAVVLKDGEIKEPTYSFEGGILMVVFPESCSDDEIREQLRNYVNANKESLVSNFNTNKKEYRKYWRERIASIISEYGINKDIPALYFHELRISVGHKNLVNVVAEVHGIMPELRFNFNPISSLVSNELVELLLKAEVIVESIGLYEKFCSDEEYERRRNELLSEYKKIEAELESKKMKAEIKRSEAIRYSCFNI